MHAALFVSLVLIKNTWIVNTYHIKNQLHNIHNLQYNKKRRVIFFFYKLGLRYIPWQTSYSIHAPSYHIFILHNEPTLDVIFLQVYFYIHLLPQKNPNLLFDI